MSMANILQKVLQLSDRCHPPLLCQILFAWPVNEQSNSTPWQPECANLEAPPLRLGGAEQTAHFDRPTCRPWTPKGF
ncbi:unnamed protein product [marine sediment metagenome]|uniref:Uncharacterized protein n=1 Tax=marine sediment metagenome TaxID=412755 RepID=X1N295_9ZZZZ